MCAAVLVGLLSTAALAQDQQEFFKINKAKDLSGGSVTSITQDEDGFIWIATKSGPSPMKKRLVFLQNGEKKAHW